jgi:acyl-coenzyme A synthetase/AMP-(fatty) acid ligase
MLCIKSAWPSMARTIAGDAERFGATYFQMFKGYYFSGDGCRRDKDGYYFLTGAGARLARDLPRQTGRRTDGHPACALAP